ncbi:MAG: PAQR family membrane homeostasis protein TrhA [Bacteroidales bacterium]
MKKNREEIANSLTHAIGIIFSIFSLVYLSIIAIKSGDLYYLISSIIFGVTMMLLYSMSTIYHSLRDIELKQIFRKLDHSAIFLFIAGSYTPFTLVTLRESSYWGWSILGIVWIAAILGTLISLRSISGGLIKTACYLLMGWLVTVAFKPLNEALAERPEVLYWLALGGISYTIGAVFYALSRYKYMHTIWHLFVLSGSFCHFMAVKYII